MALVTRREMLARGGTALLGLAATACTPAVLTRALYPESAHLDPAAIDANLAALVTTVVPGAEEPARMARLFADPALKLAPFRGALVAELDRRAHARGECSFAHLSLDDRTAVLQDALASGGIAAKLANGAVFLVQAVYFSGLWNADGACPMIGFEGPYQFRGFEALTYPDPDTFLPAATTRDGNPT